MRKDRRIFQAGLGTLVCLDCLGTKKTGDHELCNPCSSDKRWEFSRKRNEEFADWCRRQRHQAGLNTYFCLDCFSPKKKLGSERCPSCGASCAQKKIYLRPERHQKAREVMLGKQNALGHRLSDEAKAKIGVSKIGNKNMLGHHHTEDSKKKNAASHSTPEYAEKHYGPNHHMFGKHHKKESLEKMSAKRIGRPSGRKGEHPSEATLKKMSNSATKYFVDPKNRQNQSKIMTKYYEDHPEHIAKISGPNCYFWRDGKSSEPYSADWKGSLKRMVCDRDNHRCQICGTIENGRKHDVHHIDYNKKNCHPDNLTTLCNTGNNCHGATNSHRSYWPDFFKWLKGQKEADIALGGQGDW